MEENTKVRVKRKKYKKKPKANPMIFGIRKRSLVLGTIFSILLIALLVLAFLAD